MKRQRKCRMLQNHSSLELHNFFHAFTSSVPERMYERVSVCVCVLFILIVITDERVRSAPASDWILQTLAAASICINSLQSTC